MTDHAAKPQDDRDEGNINITIGGNVSGNVNAAKRDLLIVQGDEIKVGNITNGNGVAIGKNINQQITQGADPEAVKQVFTQILDRLNALQGQKQDDITDAQHKRLTPVYTVAQGAAERLQKCGNKSKQRDDNSGPHRIRERNRWSRQLDDKQRYGDK